MLEIKRVTPLARTWVWAAVAAMAFMLSMAPTAQATGGYPDDDAVRCGTDGSSWCKGGTDMSGRGYGYRNCVDYTAWKVASLGVKPAQYQGLGNANTWDDRAASKGLEYNSTPAVGSVAVSNTGYYGHVAYVEAVNGSTISISEYNHAGTGRYGTRSVPASSFAGFVHFEKYMNIITPPPTNTGTRLVDDVNGDGRADAVVMFRDSGTAKVALSSGGGSFGYPGTWAIGQSAGATRYFLADVNGDNRSDLVAYYAASGTWKVSLSSGGGFWSPTSWAVGHGVGTANQFVADVNADNRDDVITFDAGSGDWWVSLSSGSGFWSPQRWSTGHGVGSSNQLVGDMNGDKRADAGIWIMSSGKPYVALSTGSAFGYPGLWGAGHGLNSVDRLYGDTNGDGRKDAAYFSANGHWQVGLSAGTAFYTPTDWAFGHGVGTTDRFLADTNGDGRDDMVTFDRNSGDWWVSLSSGGGFWPPQRWIIGHGANS